MKHKLTAAMVFAGLVAVPMFGQTMGGKPPSKESEEIHGSGKPGHLTKFTGNRTVGDSDVVESGGQLTTSENILAGGMTAVTEGNHSVGVHAYNTTTDEDQQDPVVHAIGLYGETSSATSAAVIGLAHADHGDPIGVIGSTASTGRGIGVLGQAGSTTGNGIGVLGQVIGPDANAGVFNHMAPNGYAIALNAYSGSTDGGEGVHGQTNAATGLGIGVNGITSSPDGYGGSFTNFAGGNILRGVNNTTVEFRVDGNGMVFANGGFQPYGADFAESMEVSGDRGKYAAGDLLVIDSTSGRRLALAQEPYSTLVAGIYSTKPGMLGSLHKVDETTPKDEIPLAVVGIVPCKVSAENGAIRPGDLLVTSSLAGHAMKGTDRGKMLGAVVGKALGSLEDGTGVIEVLVTLQ